MHFYVSLYCFHYVPLGFFFVWLNTINTFYIWGDISSLYFSSVALQRWPGILRLTAGSTQLWSSSFRSLINNFSLKRDFISVTHFDLSCFTWMAVWHACRNVFVFYLFTLGTMYLTNIPTPCCDWTDACHLISYSFRRQSFNAIKYYLSNILFFTEVSYESYCNKDVT